jgi:hypothetical protein
MVLCGAGEWILWDRLKVEPCKSNATIAWKGMSKCVTKLAATLWQGLDYVTMGALAGFVFALLVTRASEPRKR